MGSSKDARVKASCRTRIVIPSKARDLGFRLRNVTVVQARTRVPRFARDDKIQVGETDYALAVAAIALGCSVADDLA
jgi:hypothetical protein